MKNPTSGRQIANGILWLVAALVASMWMPRLDSDSMTGLWD
ncbi:hypothetical protein [Enteractinococcus helveticum]|nr:hypothetical protein [Enteractinococcus helveticum]